MSLNPFQNAIPRQQVSKEAPSFFSPFFPQSLKLKEEISIWKPPPLTDEPHLRSKAPNNRPSTPRQIPTVGVSSSGHSKNNSISRGKDNSSDDGRAQLFQPKEKKSLDEIMWLGSVSGFPPPAPPPPKVEATIRTKLARKPETKTSQAMFGNLSQVPRDTRTEEQKQADLEAERKKKEEEKARRQRLAEHSKKPSDAQQGERRIKPSGRRGKVFLPIPQPDETARRSNRPNANHRPNLPRGASGYAPSNPILPQPIETTKRSNRPAGKAKAVDNEESVWMGLPQPIETARRSNRKRPVGGGDGKGETEARQTELLPQPVESTRRSNRIQKEAESSSLPQPEVVSKKSNRPAANLPQPIQVSTHSNRPANPTTPAEPETPTSPGVSFSPSIVPQPYETTKPSHRAISARPLVPQLIETSRRTNRVRAPQPEMQLEPEGSKVQPVVAPNWSDRGKYAGHHYLRRNSTNKPNAPGAVVRDRERERRLMKKVWARPIDHVSHLHEPVDSTPSTPMGSPEQSRCPSLSTSPTLSVASSTWDVANKLNKATNGARPIGKEPERVEEGFGPYMLGLDKGLRKEGALGSAGIKRERAKEEAEYPFPVVAEEKQSYDQKAEITMDGSGLRTERSETIRPKFTSTITDGVLEIKHPKPRHDSREQADDGYPICHSPVHGKFKVPWEKGPTPGDKEGARGGNAYDNSRIPTDELEVSRRLDIASINVQLPTPPDSLPSSVSNNQFFGGPRTAPSRLTYTPMAPSPGYTVASLPPTKKKENGIRAETTDEFVNGVMTYLSMSIDSVAVLYDKELALYTGISEEQVKADRKGSVKKYIERWISENPEIEISERRKGGLW